MNPSQSSERRCQYCHLEEKTLPDYLAYFMCHATIGPDNFAASQKCLAAAALRQLGIEVDIYSKLTENFDELKRKT